MRQKLPVVLCFVMAALLFACSEEETPVAEIPGLVLTETIGSDGSIVNRTEEFYYNEIHQLTRRVVKQKTTVKMNNYTDHDSLRLESRVVYNHREAVVTDAFGNVSTYALNDKGFATSCIRHEGRGTNTVRTYTFAYDAADALREVMEMIDGEFFSRIKLQPLTELYPLNLHQEAMYAQLLGKVPEGLIQTIRPEGGDETVTYTYTTDNAGNLSSCKISTRSESHVYNRTVNYAINPGKR